jgi:hypothetical protein
VLDPIAPQGETEGDYVSVCASFFVSSFLVCVFPPPFSSGVHLPRPLSRCRLPPSSLCSSPLSFSLSFFLSSFHIPSPSSSSFIPQPC